MSFVPLVRLWLWVSTFAVATGWTLSALGQLNRVGYGIAFTLFVGFIFIARKELFPTAKNGLPPPQNRERRLPAGRFCLDFIPYKRLLKRFRSALPFCFAVLALLVFVGGTIYPPSNYTGLNYHLARVLQWLAHGQWQWIHTPIARMNYTGCAFEWVTTPVVLFTKSDRAIFLVNFISFLMLPGLIFSVFTRLGIRARVARQWMWLLPTGYTFLLQAGSIGNDAFAATFALAAIDFAARAWESRRVRDLWFSLLAIALLTGVKPTSLPLLLPWLILIFPVLPLLHRHWLPTLPVMALAGVASFIPLALMNQLHCGDWLGRSVELVHQEVHQPLVGILGNAFQLVLGNFLPPVFPLAGWWNHHALTILPQSIVEAFNTNFAGGILTVGELPTEDWVGPGFGLSWLLVISVFSSVWIRGKSPLTTVKRTIPWAFGRCVAVAVWISLLAYCMKAGMNTAPRLVCSYYLLLPPLLLAGAEQSQIIRRRWWRALTGIVICLALVVLVLSPDRPLWPAKTILSKVLARHPEQQSVARALQVYTIYSQRNDALAGVRALLPPGLKVVGFLGGEDDCDISLWRPFFERRVEHFLLTDSPAQIRERAEYLVVSEAEVVAQGMSFNDWLQKMGASSVASTNIILKVSAGPQSWQIVRFEK
jgi:hypothetical protein